MMHFILLAFFSFLTTAYAETQLSLMGSLLYSNPDTNNFSNANVTDEMSGVGLGLGMRALMGLQDQLNFRSGASIIQKKFGYQTDSSGTKSDNDFSLVYLNIPLTLYWRASSQVGFFGGSALNAKLSDDCNASGSANTCTKNKVKPIVFPAIVGFDFSFTKKLGMELSYEYGMTDTAKDLKVHSAVASFLFHLD